MRYRCVLLPLLLSVACSSDPPLEISQEPGPPPDAAAQPVLPPGPYASVDLVPVPAAAAYQPPLPVKHQLGNGITVLLLPDASRPMVELELRLRVGSYSDPAGKEGLASLVASMLREGGSEDWPGDRIDEELAFRGAEIDFGAGPRATTGSLSCLVEDLDVTLDLFAEVLRQPAFPADKLELLRSRLLSEVAQRDDRPGQAANREARRAFYGVDDPRARRQELASLHAISQDDLRAFHADRYGSRQAQLAVYGDFEPDDMLARLETRFGDWEPQAATPVAVPTEAPAPESRRVVLLPREDVNQTELRLVLEGVRRNHPDYPALQLGSYVFGMGGFGNRLISRIRSELGLAYTTGAYWMPGWEQQGLFWATCGTKNSTAGLAVREMLGVLQNFLDQGVPPEEFEQARSRLLNARVFETDETDEALARIADLEWNGYPWSFSEQTAAAIRDLSAEEVVDACRRHLDPSRLMIFALGNAAEFDVELSEFGPVEIWDAGAPEVAEPSAAAPVASEHGAELAEHLLASHGGRAAWQGVGATRSSIRPGDGPPLDVVLVYPGKFFVRTAGYQPQVLSVLTEGGGWSMEDGVAVPYDADRLEQARSDLQAKLPLILMRLARGEYQASAEAELTLRLTDENGVSVALELQDSGLCRAVIGADGARYEFGAYALAGGVLLPGRVDFVIAGQATSFEFEWTVNPEVRAEWFEPPAGE